MSSCIPWLPMSKHHVCIVDSDDFFGGLLARKCEERGWCTTRLEALADAADCLRAEPDALVIDIEDIENDLESTIRTLRHGAGSSVPIVLLTRAHDPATVSRLMALGVDAYLLKGHFIPNEAVDKLHRLMETRGV